MGQGGPSRGVGLIRDAVFGLAGIDCPYYHSDFNRGQETSGCRMLEASPLGSSGWHEGLCRTCPVPGLMRDTTCHHLHVEGEIQRGFLRKRVQVTFALCRHAVEELADPMRCPTCEASMPSFN